MIVKKENITNKQFLEVDIIVLVIGEKSMVTKMLYKITDDVTTHSNHNEHNRYIVSGKFRLKFIILMKYCYLKIHIQFLKILNIVYKYLKLVKLLMYLHQ
ncbi:MAG: hypothetical protein PHG81_01300 [Aliarcobacter sp.]|nr:hypothetical protein [Aliarcobacter sp.]